MRKKFEFQGRGANSVHQKKIPGFGHRACHSRVAFLFCYPRKSLINPSTLVILAKEFMKNKLGFSRLVDLAGGLAGGRASERSHIRDYLKNQFFLRRLGLERGFFSPIYI